MHLEWSRRRVYKEKHGKKGYQPLGGFIQNGPTRSSIEEDNCPCCMAQKA